MFGSRLIILFLLFSGLSLVANDTSLSNRQLVVWTGVGAGASFLGGHYVARPVSRAVYEWSDGEFLRGSWGWLDGESFRRMLIVLTFVEARHLFKHFTRPEALGGGLEDAGVVHQLGTKLELFAVIVMNMLLLLWWQESPIMRNEKIDEVTVDGWLYYIPVLVYGLIGYYTWRFGFHVSRHLANHRWYPAPLDGLVEGCFKDPTSLSFRLGYTALGIPIAFLTAAWFAKPLAQTVFDEIGVYDPSMASHLEAAYRTGDRIALALLMKKKIAGLTERYPDYMAGIWGIVSVCVGSFLVSYFDNKSPKANDVPSPSMYDVFAVWARDNVPAHCTPVAGQMISNHTTPIPLALALKLSLLVSSYQCMEDIR